MMERVSKSFRAVLEVHYQSVREFLVDYSTNISKSGIFIKSNSPLSVDSLVSLHIHLPDGGPILNILGRVVHVTDVAEAKAAGRSAGMGIYLEEFAGTGRQDLDNFFKSLTRG